MADQRPETLEELKAAYNNGTLIWAEDEEPVLPESDVAWFMEHMDEFIIKLNPLTPVDLSGLVDSGVDCEFSFDQDFINPFVGKLKMILPGEACPYVHAVDGRWWKYCRPRMHHIHAHQGGECPLPEGVKVRVTLRGTAPAPAEEELDARDDILQKCWKWRGGYYPSDIIQYEVLGCMPGYCWPWDSDRDG